MKTSYVPKNTGGSSQGKTYSTDKTRQSAFSPNAEKDVDEEDIKEKLETAYKDIAVELEKRNQSLLNSKYEDLDDEEDEEDDEEPARNEHSNKPWIIGVCLGVAVILVGGFGIGMYMNNTSKEQKAKEQQELLVKQNSDNFNNIKDKIEAMYTDSRKSDIRDDVTQSTLDGYYKELESIKTEDTSAVTKELDTIGYFLNDKGILNGYNADSYNLDTAGMIDNINSIKSNTSNYSVSSLVLTINELGSKIVSDYNYYHNLSDELENYTDFINFDEGGYKTKIDAVTHTPNKEVLTKIYNKRVSDKRAAEINQRIIDATDDEARAQAQAELEQAQTVQGQMQNELDALRQELKKQMEEAVTTPTPEKVEETQQPQETVQTPEPTEEVTQPTEEVEESSQGDSFEDEFFSDDSN